MGCGNWHAEYLRIHRNILKGNRPNRQLVVVGLKSGFNDNLTGKLMGLYLSLLTRRALRFITYGTIPQFTSALQSPFLDLFADAKDFPPEVVSPLTDLHNGSSCYGADRTFNWTFETNKTYSPLYLVNSDAQRFFLSGDLSKYKPDVEYLMYASNRAAIYHLVEDSSEGNKANRQRLQQLGVTNCSNAFLCAFFFLFKPNQEVIKQFHKTWNKLSNSSALKIGIHVRVGDAEFAAPHDIVKGRVQIEKFLAYFRCAQEIENSRKKENQTVIWYVISDSLSIRLAAQERFGSKVLIDKLRASHLDCNHVATSCKEHAQNVSMQLAVGEMLAFSLADVHVYGKDSGYGRSGAWLSVRPQAEGPGRKHLYDLFNHERYRNRSCGISDYADPSDDSRQWSGIR